MVEGRQPHPQALCFLSAILSTSSRFTPASLALELVDAFLHPGQLFLQLVSVSLQAFLFLLRREETAERGTAPALTTTASACCKTAESWSRSRLTHGNHLLSGSVRVSIQATVSFWLANRIVGLHTPNTALAMSCLSHSDVLKWTVSPRASRKRRSTT